MICSLPGWTGNANPMLGIRKVREEPGCGSLGAQPMADALQLPGTWIIDGRSPSRSSGTLTSAAHGLKASIAAATYSTPAANDECFHAILRAKRVRASCSAAPGCGLQLHLWLRQETQFNGACSEFAARVHIQFVEHTLKMVCGGFFSPLPRLAPSAIRQAARSQLGHLALAWSELVYMRAKSHSDGSYA